MTLKEAMDLKTKHLEKIMNVIYNNIKEDIEDNFSSADLEFTGDISNLTMRVDGYEVDSKIDKPALVNIISKLLSDGYTLKANVDSREYTGDSIKGCIDSLETGCYRKIYIVISGWKE
jgi:hypothetical protein